MAQFKAGINVVFLAWPCSSMSEKRRQTCPGCGTMPVERANGTRHNPPIQCLPRRGPSRMSWGIHAVSTTQPRAVCIYDGTGREHDSQNARVRSTTYLAIGLSPLAARCNEWRRGPCQACRVTFSSWQLALHFGQHRRRSDLGGSVTSESDALKIHEEMRSPCMVDDGWPSRLCLGVSAWFQGSSDNRERFILI